MIIIGIAGGSGAGKTFLTNKLKEIFENEIEIISQDNYYKPYYELTIEQRKMINYDLPKECDFELLINNLKLLKNNECVKELKYSFTKYTRSEDYEIKYPKKIIILEGWSILYESALRELIDYSIYLDISNDERLKRKIIRDVAERGRNERDIIEYVVNVSNPAHDTYVRETMKFADLIVSDEEQAKPDYISWIVNKIKCYFQGL